VEKPRTIRTIRGGGGGFVNIPQNENQEPVAAVLGVGVVKYKSCQAIYDCFFIFRQKKISASKELSRWNVFLNSRESFDRCHRNLVEHVQGNLLKERELEVLLPEKLCRLYRSWGKREASLGLAHFPPCVLMCIKAKK
jgi:hypothetical protein